MKALANLRLTALDRSDIWTSGQLHSPFAAMRTASPLHQYPASRTIFIFIFLAAHVERWNFGRVAFETRKRNLPQLGSERIKGPLPPTFLSFPFPLDFILVQTTSSFSTRAHDFMVPRMASLHYLNVSTRL